MNEPGSHRDTEGRRKRYEAMDDVALYDVFFDWSTHLGGALVARYRMAEDAGDLDMAKAWRARHSAVRREREATDARDRNAQIDQLLAWQQEREVLVRTYPVGPAAD